MKPNKRVKLGISADMAIQESTSPSLNVDPFKYAYFANPYERIYNEDGSYAADNTYYSITPVSYTHLEFFIHTAQNLIHHLYNRHLYSKTVEERGKFHSDHSTANDDK